MIRRRNSAGPKEEGTREREETCDELCRSLFLPLGDRFATNEGGKSERERKKKERERGRDGISRTESMVGESERDGRKEAKRDT